MARVLIVQPDANVGEAVEELLTGEGYDVACVATLPQAFEAIDAHVFDLILTDLFLTRAPTSAPLGQVDFQRGMVVNLDAVAPLVARARPTPVAALTAWSVSEAELQSHGFHCLVPMPFDVDNLITCVASAVHMPLGPDQQRHLESALALFHALAAGDAAAIERLCAEQVRFVAPRPERTQLIVEGRGAFLEYVRARTAEFSNLHVGPVHMYATPRRLAVRFEVSWSLDDDPVVEVSHASVALLSFDQDGRIAQIGMETNVDRLPVAAHAPHDHTQGASDAL